MEFGSASANREGFCEEDQMGDKLNKLHYSYSSSSSPSSSSSHHHPQQQPVPLNSTRSWDNQQQMGGNIYKEDNSNAASTKQNLMETSPRNDVSVTIDKEHMFDKVVTPSDVGKLNRLVIPKQYAEKYFPLDSTTNEKDLHLNFEDCNGKPWRFRYSYWNSSQSYVMTKGWSRFVKDKKLDAGDIVSFQRGVGDLGKDRLFIDWKRRPDAPDPAAALQHHMPFQQLVPWNPLLMRPPVLPHSQINNFYNRNSYYNASNNLVSPCTLGSVFYLRSQPAATTSVHPQPQMGMVEWRQQQQPIVFDSVPVVQGKVAAKRLRLFGVNMDCPITESDECDIFSSTMAINQTYQPSQLRLYNGSPMPHPIDFLNKGKAPMSFDSGI